MRALVNAVLSYGLVNVPVGVCTATKEQDTKFVTLHKCGSRVKTPKFCPDCGTIDIPADELTKGFEVAKGEVVEIDSKIVDQLGAERSKQVRLTKFVPFDDLDELAVSSSYFLQPNEHVAEGYVLLQKALEDLGLVGIGTMSLWGKESPSMVWTHADGALVLSKLYCHDEIIPQDEIIDTIAKVSAEISEESVDMAKKFLRLNTGVIDPKEDLVSKSREKIHDYVNTVIAGKEFTIAEAAEEPKITTTTLTEALRESIEITRQMKEAKVA